MERPPSVGVGDRPEAVGVPPLGLDHRLPGAARTHAVGAGGAVPPQWRDAQFGAVPRHGRMVPADPGQPAAVRGETRAGHEVMGGGDGPFGARGERDRHEGALDVAHPAAARLPDGPDLVARRRYVEVPVGDVPAGGREGLGRVLGVRVVEVEALVAPVGEHQAGAGGAPGPAAVLVQAVAGVEPRGQHVLDPAVRLRAHDTAAAGLVGARFVPPHVVTDEGDPARRPVLAGDVSGTDVGVPGPERGRGAAGGGSVVHGVTALGPCEGASGRERGEPRGIGAVRPYGEGAGAPCRTGGCGVVRAVRCSARGGPSVLSAAVRAATGRRGPAARGHRRTSGERVRRRPGGVVSVAAGPGPTGVSRAEPLSCAPR